MLARPEVGSKEHILLWLAAQPQDKKFSYMTPSACACGQYSRAFLGSGMKWLKILAKTGRHYSPDLEKLDEVAFKLTGNGKRDEVSFGALYDAFSTWRGRR